MNIIYKPIQVRSIGKIELVSQEDVLFFEADNNYCIIHLINGGYKVVSTCMKQFLLSFSSNQFLKIHRKFIVNVAHVVDVDISNSTLLLVSGRRIKISRANRKIVKNWFFNASKNILKFA